MSDPAEWTRSQNDRTRDVAATHKPTVKKNKVPTNGRCAARDQECHAQTPPLPPGTTDENFANYGAASWYLAPYVAVVGTAAVLYACVCIAYRRT